MLDADGVNDELAGERAADISDLDPLELEAYRAFEMMTDYWTRKEREGSSKARRMLRGIQARRESLLAGARARREERAA